MCRPISSVSECCWRTKSRSAAPITTLPFLPSGLTSSNKCGTAKFVATLHSIAVFDTSTAHADSGCSEIN